eukprot:CAMPEP_0184429942 /NCGR_PEP_ID=MMETSP0738-20130409/256952_1 /TAXON_ID=385413 /ORGANISM="Thalassiosira miniscula, Strain CCMP1093" /LENGTH=173 /DNA_ID=CAMNT_0026794355 /DNA_START=495 /DNA_END=1011 /DNA_ORIENTATION=-
MVAIWCVSSRELAKASPDSPVAADVEHDVHCALRRNEANGVLIGYDVFGNFATALEWRGDLAFQGFPLRQSEHSGILDETRYAVGGVGGEVDQVGDDLFRPRDPTDPRPGHGMGLGHGTNHKRALGHVRQGAGTDVLPFPNLGVINLVGDQPQVMVFADLRDAGERVTAVDGA